MRHVNSGFKLFPRHLVADMPIESNGWFVDAEVLFRLQRQGLTYAEIPVELVDRSLGRSSIGRLAFVKVLGELVRFAYRLRRSERT